MIELRRVRMPLVRPFATSRSVTQHREVWLARVVGDDEKLDGWGEADDPRLAAELARMDAELKLTGVPLAQHLGGTRTHIDSTATVGFEDADRVDEFLATGYRSLKLKVAPDHPPPSIPSGACVQVDANGSFASCPERVLELDDLGLLAIEQPLGVDDFAGHAALTEQLRTPICLDESITSVDAVMAGTCQAVCVKYERLGGLAQAKAVHDRCVELGLGAKVGGNLETGIGRAAALALASLPGFTLPADLSASDRYWARDITTPFVLDADGRLPVPTGPGLGVDVDLDAVNAHTVTVEIFPNR